MRVLAIDTALGACAAAVLDSQAGAILASESVGMLRGHAEAVMPMIARVMDAARCEFAGIDRVAVTVGPGSFTGLRVGIAAARGIALAPGRPAIGLSPPAAPPAPPAAARSARPILARRWTGWSGCSRVPRQHCPRRAQAMPLRLRRCMLPRLIAAGANTNSSSC